MLQEEKTTVYTSTRYSGDALSTSALVGRAVQRSAEADSQRSVT